MSEDRVLGLRFSGMSSMTSDPKEIFCPGNAGSQSSRTRQSSARRSRPSEKLEDGRANVETDASSIVRCSPFPTVCFPDGPGEAGGRPCAGGLLAGKSESSCLDTCLSRIFFIRDRMMSMLRLRPGIVVDVRWRISSKNFSSVHTTWSETRGSPSEVSSWYTAVVAAVYVQ